MRSSIECPKEIYLIVFVNVYCFSVHIRENIDSYFREIEFYELSEVNELDLFAA